VASLAKHSAAWDKRHAVEVYQVGLSFMRWFQGLPGGAELSSRLYRQVDKAGTSMI
jgi:hypothetical protein